jgi:hypothetical protein
VRVFVLSASVAAALVGLVTAVRLGAMVSITPESLWFVENPRLLNPSIEISESTKARAGALATLFRDPALFRARASGCFAASGAGESSAEECTTAIDDALRAAPLSGELWLMKAIVSFRDAQDRASAFEALQKSYAASGKEGWLAVERVVFGLRLYPLLPDDLKALILEDLTLVLPDPTLSAPLIEAYARDATLRSSAATALELLPPPAVDDFIERVQQVAG